MKVPETKLEHLQNLRRLLYIKIGIDARDTAFCIHQYKISKKNHMTLTKYKNDKLYYDNKQMYPSCYWKHDYRESAKQSRSLINKLFSIPFCQDNKLINKTRQLLNINQWLDIADIYDHLQEITDAPEAHWQWRNAHQNPGKMAPEQKTILDEDEKVGKLAHKYGYLVRHYTQNGHYYTVIVYKNSNQGVPKDKIPRSLRNQIKCYLTLANYYADRK